VTDTDGPALDGSRVASDNVVSTSERLLATLERLLDIQPTNLKLAMDQVATLIADVLGTDKVDAFLHEPETDTLVAVGASNTPMGRHQGDRPGSPTGCKQWSGGRGISARRTSPGWSCRG
jgi:hypothetical protein